MSNDFNTPMKSAVELLMETIDEMDMGDLIKSAPDVYDIVRDPVDLTMAKSAFLNRAAQIGDKKLIQSIFSAIEKKRKKEEKIAKAQQLREEIPIYLDTDPNGVPLDTINNFLNIMLLDNRYKNIRFNLVSNQAEVVTTNEDGEQELKNWTDTEDAMSRNYIEEQYKLFSVQKHTDALRILFRRREYNPIIDLIDTFQWDGENRVEHFLTRWLNAEDTPYIHEVSRLIFAGGINRLYNPGCKFDDVPVLVGTRQGEGKSTIIKWLALNEQWFSEVKKVDGADSIEALFGAWICEIPELSAFKRADDVESIKAFVTRTKDKYRKPYDKTPVEYPRRCVFIGTTNNAQFLSDKTGNRRFYPVTANSSGYDLYAHEEECKEYIRQCWAEARDRFKKGEMPPFANYALLKDYQAKQEEAMEDDWRVGKIADYLELFGTGEKVCAYQIFIECLYPDSSIKPKSNDSRVIGQIMAKMDGWTACGIRKTDKYGRQRCWEKTGSGEQISMSLHSAEELPF